jgi:hypothetical protein
MQLASGGKEEITPVNDDRNYILYQNIAQSLTICILDYHWYDLLLEFTHLIRCKCIFLLPHKYKIILNMNILTKEIVKIVADITFYEM